MTQFVVLAGGLGTRLRGHLAPQLPKAMASVGGIPFIDRVLAQAALADVDDILLLLGHSAEAIVEHIGDSFEGVSVRHVIESRPLGTGGALRNAVELLDDRFVLVNGDTYVSVNVNGLVDALDISSVSLTLSEVADAGRFARVVVDSGRVIGFREKGPHGPGLINAGAYGLTRELIETLPQGESSLELDLLERDIKRLRPAYVMAGPPFFDIGIKRDWDAADRHFGLASPGLHGS